MNRNSSVVCRAAIPLVLALCLAGCQKKAAPPPPPPEVIVTCAETRDVPVPMEFIGQTKGSTDVEIRARVEGFLDSIDFKEGGLVKKGELLYQIDPKPFQAILAEARASEARAKAMLGRAGQDVDRLKPLAEARAVPQRDYDVAVSNRDAAEASLQAAKAAVEKAQLDLGYTRITSPLDGLAGMTQVQIGNLVGRGQSTLLTTISTVDPIAVRFSISEAEYMQLARKVAEAEKAVSAGGEKPAPVPIEMQLADGSVHPYPGQIRTAERVVDAATGTLMLEAVFPNPERLVRPGQYARVRAVTEVKKGAVVIPQRAVQEMQGIYNLAIVGPDNKVSFRPVTAGLRTGSDWVVEKGLEPGECFVAEGLQRIRDGMVVAPKKAPAEGAEPAGAEGGQPGAEGGQPGAEGEKPAAGEPGGEGSEKSGEGHGN